jgi:hypothetical protein
LQQGPCILKTEGEILTGKVCEVCAEKLQSNQWHDERCQLRTYGYKDALADDAKNFGKMGFSCLVTLVPLLLIWVVVVFWLMG